MKKANKIGLVMIFVMLALLFAKDASALGISPGKSIVNFEPKLRKEITLTIYNTERHEFRAIVMARGELADYITLSSNLVEFREGESEKSITYELVLPISMDIPGTHTGEIIIRELPSGESEGEIVVGALVSVVSEIQVRVPYPGKYAETELDIVSKSPNENVDFFLRVQNLGEQDIEKANAFFYIYDTNNNLISVVKSDEQELKKTQRKELKASWSANASIGTYKVTAVLDYDGVIKNTDKSFVLGNFFARVLDVSVKNFKLGGIAKFNALTENLATEKLEGVSVQMSLNGKDSQRIADISSTPDSIEPKSKKELALFWDTENVQEGTYEGTLTAKYSDKSSENRIKVNVEKDNIKAEINGITGRVISDDEVESSFTISKDTLLIIGIVMLVAINLCWLIYFKLSKKKNEPPS